MEFLENRGDDRILQVGVPDIDARVVLKQRKHCPEHRAKELPEILDVDLPILVRPVLAGVLRSVRAGVADAVRRVRGEEGRVFPTEDELNVLGVGGVPAEDPMVAEDPDVALLRNGVFRRGARAWVIQSTMTG